MKTQSSGAVVSPNRFAIKTSSLLNSASSTDHLKEIRSSYMRKRIKPTFVDPRTQREDSGLLTARVTTAPSLMTASLGENK